MHKKKIVFVSHCVLNTRSKVRYSVEFETTEERNRKAFLRHAIEKDIQFIQLPCPEFLLYGARRWGHSKDQFDNAFYRERCRELLKDIILQMKEYLSEPDRVEVLGIIGIDGSPSCGVNRVFTGAWGGEMSSNPDLEGMIRGGACIEGKGVFIEVLMEMLKEENIELPILPLTEDVLEVLTNED